MAMELSWLLFLVTVAAGIVAYLHYYTFLCRPWRKLPGPAPWPIIGNLHLLGPYPHQTFARLAKEYGPVFLLRLGYQPTLIVSSPAIAKEILFTHDKVFADRPPMDAANIIFYPGALLFTQYGDEWRVGRKICMLHAFSPKKMQDAKPIREAEISDMMHSIQKQSQEDRAPVNLGTYVGRCVSNVICRMLISQSDDKLRIGDMEFREAIHETSSLMGIPLIGDFIPCLGWLDFRTKRRMYTLHEFIDAFLQSVVSERVTHWRASQAADSSDLLDVLLSLKNDGQLKDENIKSLLMDLMTAGTESTSDTMEWILAEMLRHPRVFMRLRQEVDSAVECREFDKLVDETIIGKLTYMNAVIKETFRLHPITPLLIPHMSMTASRVGGYDVPGKTIVIVNAWAIGRSREVWGENCEEFIPERFMEGEKKKVDFRGQHFELLPFGSGRRICVGMRQAVTMIAMMLANIVHRFDLQLVEGQDPKDMDMRELQAFTLRRAQPLIVVAKPRPA